MSSSSSAPQQPPTAAAYTQPSNPVERNPAESATTNTSTSSPHTNNDTTAHRTPPPPSTTAGSGVPTSLARGVHGSETSSAGGASGLSSDEGAAKQRADVDADEQMAPPGEGAVADAVTGGAGKTGAAGAGGLPMEADLERKKAEQAPLREAVEGQRAHGVDVGGALGQTGGPAT